MIAQRKTERNTELSFPSKSIAAMLAFLKYRRNSQASIFRIEASPGTLDERI
jgi:hypothetical protein